MHGERDGAAGALPHLAAVGTLEKRRVAPAVEQEQRLLPPRGRRDRSRRRAPRTRRSLRCPAPSAPPADPRSPPAAAAGSRCARGAAAAGAARRTVAMVSSDGRGAAQHQRRALEPGAHRRDVAGEIARRLAVLVAGLVLLVHHDDAEILHRSEDRRARADGHPPLAPAQQPPGVGPLAVGERAVQHRDLVAERAAEPAHRLGREADLGHQHDRAAAPGQRALHRLEVDQRLAAAR